jgi:hypothetical protein
MLWRNREVLTFRRNYVIIYMDEASHWETSPQVSGGQGKWLVYIMR